MNTLESAENVVHILVFFKQIVKLFSQVSFAQKHILVPAPLGCFSASFLCFMNKYTHTGVASFRHTGNQDSQTATQAYSNLDVQAHKRACIQAYKRTHMQ